MNKHGFVCHITSVPRLFNWHSLLIVVNAWLCYNADHIFSIFNCVIDIMLLNFLVFCHVVVFPFSPWGKFLKWHYQRDLRDFFPQLIISLKYLITDSIFFYFSWCHNSEAEKAAQVSKIEFDQKIMEKESLRKMSEIEGRSCSNSTLIQCYFLCVFMFSSSSSLC